MLNFRLLILAGALTGLSLTAACGGKAKEAGETLRQEAEAAAEEMVIGSASVMLESKSGTEVTGVVNFQEIEVKAGDRVVDHRLIVTYDIQGLPEGEGRGFHIHEFGDCSSPDAMSAGGHFNPTDVPHGGPHDDASHAGDLGNVVANADGRAVGTLTFPSSKFSIAGDKADNIIGKSVIVHVAKDDYVSQPTGDAGPRAACGVIEAIN